MSPFHLKGCNFLQIFKFTHCWPFKGNEVKISHYHWPLNFHTLLTPKWPCPGLNVSFYYLSKPFLSQQNNSLFILTFFFFSISFASLPFSFLFNLLPQFTTSLLPSCSIILYVPFLSGITLPLISFFPDSYFMIIDTDNFPPKSPLFLCCITMALYLWR